jgi:DNA helicase-2/ATP-dependent DNA helicase PcrA
VILAGPGAGKTRTLVARVGYLLASTSEHRGVAAITYTDAAARELSARLTKLGLRPGRRLASRTVHAFCLQHVLPYGKIAGHPLPTDFQVLDQAGSDRLWAESLTEAKVYFSAVRRELPTVTRIRRRVAAGEGVEDFTPHHRLAVQLYEQRLATNGLLDFDEMTHRALRVLRESQAARELLTSRFPHLVVDEYQDLGPVLHALVTTLHGAGMTVTAVGDPDQTMFEFQGADPRYLHELAPVIGCEPVQLTLNYRSGSALVAAGRAALGADRGYTHDPDRSDPGVIDIRPVDGDLDAHAARTVEVITELSATGVPPEDIAVLYPGQTDLHELVEQALTDANIAFDNERARGVPDGPLGDLVMACTARRLSGPLPGRTAATHPAQGSPKRTTGGGRIPPTTRDLAAMWHRLLSEAGMAAPDVNPRSLARRLLGLLDSPERERPEDDGKPFLSALKRAALHSRAGSGQPRPS